MTTRPRNAQALVDMGAAVLVPDQRVHRAPARPSSSMRCSPTRAGSHAMREAARENGHPDAAARVAELVDAHAR